MIVSAKSNPHTWFFAYVNNLEGYNKEFAKVIREGIILEYTDGLTGSLSELHCKYPAMYNRMKNELLKESVDELNQARKRLIAVLFSYLKNGNNTPSIQYVKAVACQSARMDKFSDISLMQLKSLYQIFGAKNKNTLLTK